VKLTREQIKTLNSYVENGYINKRKHPECNLYLYKYSVKQSFAPYNEWCEIIKMCRGLILTEDYNIVAKPFEKFFNLHEENIKVDESILNYELIEKLDGSLIITYFNPILNKFECTTTGSFESEQAKMANDILINNNIYEKLYMSYTYCFELIHPENRIVVDYGDIKDVILLGVFDINTGKKVIEKLDGVKNPKKYKFNNLNELNNFLQNSKNFEGFVIETDDKKLHKLKTQEYIKLHYLKNQLNKKSAFDLYYDSLGSLESVKNYDIQEINDYYSKEFKNIKNILDNELNIINDLYNKYIEQNFKIIQNLTEVEKNKHFALYVIGKTPKQYHSLLFEFKNKKSFDKFAQKVLKLLIKNIYLQEMN